MCRFPSEGEAQFAVSTKSGDLILYSITGNLLWQTQIAKDWYHEILSGYFYENRPMLFVRDIRDDTGILFDPSGQSNIYSDQFFPFILFP